MAAMVAATRTTCCTYRTKRISDQDWWSGVLNRKLQAKWTGIFISRMQLRPLLKPHSDWLDHFHQPMKHVGD